MKEHMQSMRPTLTVAHLYVIPKGCSTRQAGKESHRGVRGKSAPGSPAEREKKQLGLCWRCRARLGAEGEERDGEAWRPAPAACSAAQ